MENKIPLQIMMTYNLKLWSNWKLLEKSAEVLTHQIQVLVTEV